MMRTLIAALLLGSGAAAAQSTSERIVPLTLALTETIYEIGAGGAVVAVPAGTEAIEATAGLPRLGQGRMPSVEAIIAARPTLVIGDSSIGSTLAVQLRRAGLTVRLTSAAETVAGAEARIAAVGRWLHREDSAAAVQARLRQDLARAASLRTPQPLRAVFIYARGLGTVYAAGQATGATTLLELAGASNPITAFEGYKPLTAEALIAARPEVIVMTRHGLASVGGIDGLLKVPGIATTPAGRSRRIVPIDDHLILGFGPWAGEAAVQLATAFRSATPSAAATPRAR